MSGWTGAAAVCMRDGKMLMVLQGTPEEEKTWSVPSGGRMPGEAYEACCVREVLEETGYRVQVRRLLSIKNDTVRYYEVDMIGGGMGPRDPDNLIYDVGWKSADEIRMLQLTYEEDRKLLLEMLSGR